jgi:asparagine synthetase B (glutamine-hydrolysing)
MRHGPWLASFGASPEPVIPRGFRRILFAPAEQTSRSLAVFARADDAPPARAESGNEIVVFDGVLYDDRETRFAERAAHTVLHDVAASSEAQLAGLRGAFGFLVWDKRRGVGRCVRDPMGIHPLYYADLEQELLVSSHSELLLAYPDVKRIPNPVAIAAQLALIDIGPEETLVASVQEVPPGHVLTIEERGRTVRRYWDPELAECAPFDAENAQKRFELLLGQAVERALPHGAAAVFLSGGLDSSAVAAVAVERANEIGTRPPLALSLAFAEPAANEEEMQRRIAEGLALRRLTRRLDETAPRGILRAALELSQYSSWPAVWIQPAYEALAGLAKEDGREVLLTGEGGDEWLLPTLYHPAESLASGDLGGLWLAWRTRRGYYPAFRGVRSVALAVWSRGVRVLIRDWAVTHAGRSVNRALVLRRRAAIERSLPPWLAPDDALRAELVDRAIQRLEEKVQTIARRERLELPVMRRILHYYSGVRQRVGVRVEAPLIDTDLVEFLWRAPARFLVEDGAKTPLRNLLRRHLPSLASGWPGKVTTEAVLLGALRREGPALWREMGGVPVLADAGVVDEAEATRQAPELLQAPLRKSEPLWEALNTEVWLRNKILG